MLTGLLLVLNILVCIALVGVVLLQRSEGGALGMGGGPGGLVTARGAGDLLTRTTWILFSMFLALSLSLTLLGAHNRADSSVIEKLKLQRAAPSVVMPAPAAPSGPEAPAPETQTPTGSLFAPPQNAPLSAPAPTISTGPAAAAAPTTHAAPAKPRPAAHAAPTLLIPPPAPAAIQAQPPAPTPTITVPPPAPKADGDAPVKTDTP